MIVWWLLLAMVGKLGDLLTTIYFVERWGSQMEGNPLVRWTIQKWGLPTAMVANFMFFFVIVLMQATGPKPHWIKYLTYMMFAVIIWNLIGIYIRHKTGQ